MEDNSKSSQEVSDSKDSEKFTISHKAKSLSALVSKGLTLPPRSFSYNLVKSAQKSLAVTHSVSRYTELSQGI